MEPNESICTQAGSIGEVLNGNVDLSCLMWVSMWLGNQDSFKWNCKMVKAIQENEPMKVLQLAGSHHFQDPFQNRIASILVECACEMINGKAIEVPKVEIEEIQTVQKSPSNESVSELKQENLFDTWQLPTKCKIKHNARQALLRHYRVHGELSEDAVDLYAKRYNEPVEELRRYFEEIPTIHGKFRYTRRLNTESAE